MLFNKISIYSSRIKWSVFCFIFSFTIGKDLNDESKTIKNHKFNLNQSKELGWI